MTELEKSEYKELVLMIERLKQEIEQVWKENERYLFEYIMKGQYEKERALRIQIGLQIEYMRKEAYHIIAHLPPFMVDRNGYYEIMPMTPEKHKLLWELIRA